MGKFIDLTGQRFGKWVVIKHLQKEKWLCKCDCGTKKPVSGHHLKNGVSKSCGCVHTPIVNLIGKRFGRLVVLKLDHVDKKLGSYWECLCDCGNKKIVSNDCLRKGERKKGQGVSSCGCLKKEAFALVGQNNFVDLTGQKFGMLTALKGIKKPGCNRYSWLCKCDCGKEIVIEGNVLRSKSNAVRSCGCSRKKIKPIKIKKKRYMDLIGQKYGKLTPLEYRGNKRWLCRCDCGTEKEISMSLLRNGNTKSCGCSKAKFISFKKIKDLTGKRFHRLTVIKKAEGNKNGNTLWLCRCDCGKEEIIPANSLKKRKGCSCECYYMESSFNGLYRQYKKQAEIRGLEFKISENEFRKLTKDNCFYCGAEPMQKKAGRYIYNGVDRVDSSKGYIQGNIVSCCGICNFTKGTKSCQEFLHWIERIYKFSNLGWQNEQNVC